MQFGEIPKVDTKSPPVEFSCEKQPRRGHAKVIFYTFHCQKYGNFVLFTIAKRSCSPAVTFQLIEKKPIAGVGQMNSRPQRPVTSIKTTPTAIHPHVLSSSGLCPLAQKSLLLVDIFFCMPSRREHVFFFSCDRASIKAVGFCIACGPTNLF